LTALIAVLGTTISPYLFFWQASQEVEEVTNNPGEEALRQAPGQARIQLGRIRIDTYVGMAFSPGCILHYSDNRSTPTLEFTISSSAQAALAQKPGGPLRFPAVRMRHCGDGPARGPGAGWVRGIWDWEARRWRVGLERKPREAVRFYAAICAATLDGSSLNFFGIDPIKALFWAAVLNGLVAAPLMVVIMIMASSPKVMGKFTIPRYLRVVGWIATGVMVCVCLGVLAATWK
jgi:Mn2+/Fe2+ NRAMP family transporter